MLGKERITKILIFSLSKGKFINTYSTVKLLLGCSTLQCNSNTLWNHHRTMIRACMNNQNQKNVGTKNWNREGAGFGNEIMLSKCKVLSTQVIHEMNRKTHTCIISGASGPHMEAPRTLSVSASTTSFITVFSCRLETKMRTYILIRKHRKHREHLTIKVKRGGLEYYPELWKTSQTIYAYGFHGFITSFILTHKHVLILHYLSISF